MITEKILMSLRSYNGEPIRLQVAALDLAKGETTKCYWLFGAQKDFNSIYEFSAHALISVDQQMTGTDPISYTNSDWALFEAHACEPESWMTHYNAIVSTQNLSYFPTTQMVGFELPSELERKLFLAPNFSEIEECFVAQSADLYVLFYWHTTA